jgi:hypothetical protein
MNNNLKISISKYNMKLDFSSFNLPPLKSCTPESCRTCGTNGCYALKSYKQYPNVKESWDNNLYMVNNHRDIVASQLIEYLKKYKKKYFRIHTSGDFNVKDNQGYFYMWVGLAYLFPDIQFLAYTKVWDVLLNNEISLPKNLHIKLSDWQGITIPEELKALYPTAYIINNDLVSIARSQGFICTGSCMVCKHCYNNNDDVTFIKH